jgi:hypothetical protein
LLNKKESDLRRSFENRRSECREGLVKEKGMSDLLKVEVSSRMKIWKKKNE